MIKLENTEVMGWEAAIRGMRNPMNSWDKSDSRYLSCIESNRRTGDVICPDCGSIESRDYYVGPNDLNLMTRLRNAGTDHRKFMRMITVYVDITAPLYWWKEFDTYKVGTVANSCSTMHKIADREFTLEDFSYENLMNVYNYADDAPDGFVVGDFRGCLEGVVHALNDARKLYLAVKSKPMKDNKKRPQLMKKYWWQMIQLLPTSYNQRRTIMFNYEVLANIHKSRNNHKLDEWHTFCDWVKTLPYSELITGESNG